MITRALTKLLPVTLICLAAIGCGGPTEPDYGFGEKDMQDAILGEWQGTMTLTGHMPTTFTLSITQAPPSLEPACQSRTFSEPACVNTTSMNLDATLTTADALFDGAKLKGTFFIAGLTLDHGELSLSGAGIQVFSGIQEAKASHDMSVSGDQNGAGVMKR
jgi:hypothetical protein